MNVIDEELAKNNEHFWLEMTKQGTLRYCHEMLKLSLEFQKERPDVVGYYEHLESLDDKILSYMDMVNELHKQGRFYEIQAKDSPFPSDLHGYIHDNYSKGQRGSFQPNHLMCKLAVLRDEVNKLCYEFLIEYDIFETDVEIYFGIKAVSDSWNTTPHFQNKVLGDWRLVREMGAYDRDKHRFKMTNNGNNGTFWPFWWRLEMDCKESLVDAVQIIAKFYRDYKKSLKLNDAAHPRFNNVASEIVNSLVTEDDYNNLIKKIKKDFNDNISILFEQTLNKCVEEGLLEERYIEGKKYFCTKRVVKPLCIMRSFFDRQINKTFGDKRIPIGALSKVILDKHGRMINSSNWRKSIDQIWDNYEWAKEKISEWFPDTGEEEK